MGREEKLLARKSDEQTGDTRRNGGTFGIQSIFGLHVPSLLDKKKELK